MTIEELSVAFRGEVLRPGDPDYDEARTIWNAMVDKRPAVIFRCGDTNDVVRAVNFARENRLLLAVRGGGRNIAGSALADGGVVIDLSRMRAVRVDRAARRVVVEAARRWPSAMLRPRRMGSRCRSASTRPRASAA
jgi:FAD/FMN-containing dehydrogenase